MMRSPLHSLPICLLLSRSLLGRLPGEADLRIFDFFRKFFQNVLVVSYSFSFSIFIFCFSDFRTKFRFDTAENEPAENLQKFRKMHFRKMHFVDVLGRRLQRCAPCPESPRRSSSRRSCSPSPRRRGNRGRAPPLMFILTSG